MGEDEERSRSSWLIVATYHIVALLAFIRKILRNSIASFVLFSICRTLWDRIARR